MNDKMIKNVDDNDNNNGFEEIQVNLKLKKNIAQVGRLMAKHCDDGNFDQFISEEVSKIILALASSPSILSPPSISYELNQHIQKLLEEEEKEMLK